MKIGIISHLKHPVKEPFAGGLEAFTFEITRRLERRGHKITLFASESSDPRLPVHSILDDKNYNKRTGLREKVKDLPSEYIAEHHAYHQLMFSIDDFGFDIVFNNSLHYIPVTMANLMRTPMVTVLHTPPFYELAMAIKAEQKHPCIHYYTVSFKNAESWRCSLPHCGVIYNGIDISQWKFYEEGRQEEYAVWFGRIHPDKGLEYAIKAAQRANIPLKIAGSIADKRYYADKIKPLLTENVELLGILNHCDLNVLIGKAKVCLVTPAWEEPFGLVVAEAMACGTPVAGFSIGALPEIVDEVAGKLVSFGNVEQLAKGLIEASKIDRKLVRNYCEKKFHIDKMVDQYEEILRRHCVSTLRDAAVTKSDFTVHG